MELPTPEDLRERRNGLGLTQSELAERAEVSQPLIARIEGGDVDPRLSTLRRIVNAMEEAEGSLLRAADLMNSPVYGIDPDDSVKAAIGMMNQEGYSQLPVIRDGQPEGGGLEPEGEAGMAHEPCQRTSREGDQEGSLDPTRLEILARSSGHRLPSSRPDKKGLRWGTLSHEPRARFATERLHAA
jgi:transcriptional regulator with XRE-family HTH domain